jgi:hypothetical protein
MGPSTPFQLMPLCLILLLSNKNYPYNLAGQNGVLTIVSPVVLSEHSWGGALFIFCSKIDPTQFPQFCVNLEHSYRSGEGFCTYIPLLLVSFSYSSPFCFSCLVSLVICFSLGFVELASLMGESSWSLLIW